MAPAVLSEIEREFARLSPEAQLTLLERLIHRVRETVAGKDTWESDLAAMAADLQVQRELSRINAEFAVTEADGLERHGWPSSAAKSTLLT
jgi:hypothetical protein